MAGSDRLVNRAEQPPLRGSGQLGVSAWSCPGRRFARQDSVRPERDGHIRGGYRYRLQQTAAIEKPLAIVSRRNARLPAVSLQRHQSTHNSTPALMNMAIKKNRAAPVTMLNVPTRSAGSGKGPQRIPPNGMRTVPNKVETAFRAGSARSALRQSNVVKQRTKNGSTRRPKAMAHEENPRDSTIKAGQTTFAATVAMEHASFATGSNATARARPGSATGKIDSGCSEPFVPQQRGGVNGSVTSCPAARWQISRSLRSLQGRSPCPKRAHLL